MKRMKIQPDMAMFPEAFRPLLTGADIYDSSCSPEARVWFLDRDEGFFLKTAPKGTLGREAAMTRFFHSKGLGAEVLAYESGDADWLLTSRVPGEDCLDSMYMDNPVRICDTTAELLRMLHDTEIAGCPAPDRTAEYLETARRNYEAKAYDTSLFPDNWGYASAEEAWRVVQDQGHLLKTDTLLHGDYCFPNIMLDHWKFAGFIDLGAGGVGDRHVDLFWGQWSLQFNLKTDRYCQRFLDAYGREKIQEEMLRIVGAIEVFG